MSTKYLTWVHVTDLHVSLYQAPEQQRKWQALEKDLEGLRDGSLQIDFRCGDGPDLLLITGDVAFSGVPPEYDVAAELVTRLAGAAGVDVERVLMAPGNHDVNRALHDPALSDWAISSASAREMRERCDALWTNEDYLLSLERQFGGFRAFQSKFWTVESQPLGCWRQVGSKFGLDYEIFGINSAWLCGSDRHDQRGKPVVGSFQRELLTRQGQGSEVAASIVLQHHPTSYLHDLDRGPHLAWLQGRRAICLAGHLHEQTAQGLRVSESESIEVVSGAGYQGAAGPLHYSWGRLDLESGELLIALRRLDEDLPDFFYAPDTKYEKAPDGLVQFSRRQPRRRVRRRSSVEPEAANSSSRSNVVVLLDQAKLSYADNAYTIRCVRRLRNAGKEPLSRYFVRVMVDVLPKEPERSREHYRQHPLKLEEAEFFAKSGDRSMDISMIHDYDASKELYLLFSNADGSFYVESGAEAVIEYGYDLGADMWGKYFERTIRLPTERIEVSIAFPSALAVTVSGMEASPTSDRDLGSEIRETSRGEQTFFEWAMEQPHLDTRYRFEWDWDEQLPANPTPNGQL